MPSAITTTNASSTSICLLELKRAGANDWSASADLVECLGVGHVGQGERVEATPDGCVVADHESIGRGCGDAHQLGVIAHLRPRGGIAQAFEVEPGIFTGEGSARVERDISSQLQRELSIVRGPRPAARQLRLRLKLLVVLHKPVVDQVVER